MFTKGFIKKSLKEVAKNWENNLVRLRFDFYRSDQQLKEMYKKKDMYSEMEKDIDKIANEIEIEKKKVNNQKDKKKVIDLEAKLDELKKKVSNYNDSIKIAKVKKEEQRSGIKSTENGIKELKVELTKCLSDEKLLNFLKGIQNYEEFIPEPTKTKET